MTLLSLGELEIFVIYSFCRILGQREACRGNISLMRSNASGESDTSSNGASSGSIWTSALTTSITSIYFDSSTMDLYSERLKRSEGAKLFRIRWYGPSKPRGDENVFLELKTHHECWIGDAYVKERVAIQEDDVAQLLAVDNRR